MKNKKLGVLANLFVILSDLSRIHKENRMLFKHCHKQSQIYNEMNLVPENDEYPKISTFQFLYINSCWLL